MSQGWWTQWRQRPFSHSSSEGTTAKPTAHLGNTIKQSRGSSPLIQNIWEKSIEVRINRKYNQPLLFGCVSLHCIF
jgi:hypothetical protein